MDTRLHPLHIVKLGGSLITDKSGYCQLNRAAVGRLGDELAEGLAEGFANPSQGPAHAPVIVLGGGSFGNGIPLRYGLSRPGFKKKDLSRMTCGMHMLLGEVAAIWRERGIAVFPIQASAVVSAKNQPYNGQFNPLLDAHFDINTRPIADALAHGLIPLISGDLILSDPPCILSSDHIPALVARRMAVGRVSFLTDVSGLLDLSHATPAPIPRITLETADCAVSLAGCSSVRDVTGGMKTKVAAALALLRLGVESEFVDGRIAGVFRSVLGGHEAGGTQFSRMAHAAHEFAAET